MQAGWRRPPWSRGGARERRAERRISSSPVSKSGAYSWADFVVCKLSSSPPSTRPAHCTEPPRPDPGSTHHALVGNRRGAPSTAEKGPQASPTLSDPPPGHLPPAAAGPRPSSSQLLTVPRHGPHQGLQRACLHFRSPRKGIPPVLNFSPGGGCWIGKKKKKKQNTSPLTGACGSLLLVAALNSEPSPAVS